MDEGSTPSDRGPDGLTTDQEGHRRTWVDRAVVAAAFLTALLVRILPSCDAILQSDWVRFREVDAWYHMRLVDALARHFPLPIAFDPYFVHSGSHAIPVAPLWDVILYLPSWLIGLGAPSQRMIDVSAALVPPVCGALTCAVVWFIARDLWNRSAAFLSAFVCALMPSQFLARTLIGYSDHHAGEVLFSTLFLALLFRLLPSKAGGNEKPSRVGILVAFAGFSLALNLLAWSTALLTVVIVTGAIAAHSVIAIARRTEVTFLPRVCAALAVALAIVVPWLGYPSMGPSTSSLVAGISVVVMLLSVIRGMNRGLLSARGGLASFAVFMALAAMAGALLLPDLVTRFGELLVRLRPSPTKATIGETLSLQDIGFRALLHEYTSAAWVAPVGLVLVARDWWRRLDPRVTILLVWTLTMMGLTLVQIRFSYYLSVMVALFAGACASRLLDWIVGGAREGEPRRVRIYGLVALAGLCLVLVGPEVRPAVAVSSMLRGPDEGWFQGLTWLRTHSPEPFPSGAYLARPTKNEADDAEPSYRVLAWWDYGYWIIRIAHRVPVANPTQEGAASSARFYLSRSAEEASRVLSELDAAWVITNHDLLVLRYAEGRQLTKAFPAMAVWAGIPIETFYETWEYRTDAGDWLPVRMFYPEYFETMAVRLQLEEGKAYVPDRSVWIARWDDHRYEDGRVVKRLRSLVQYSTWDGARETIEEGEDSRARIVSIDPYASCVPLEPVDQLEKAWTSADRDVAIWRRREGY